MNKYASLRPVASILISAAVMLSLVMGLRQSLGLFVQPAVRDLSMAVADFTLAIAIQNLAWGVLQPFAGAWAARFGFRPVMLMGAVAFVLGMLALATATGFFGVPLGAGLLIGFALACCGSGVAMAVASRPVPAVLRSSVRGMVSAAGSLGAMISAPIGQSLSVGFGWRAGVLGFVVIALIIGCDRDPSADSITSHRSRFLCAWTSSTTAACTFRPSCVEASAFRILKLDALAGAVMSCLPTVTPKRWRNSASRSTISRAGSNTSRAWSAVVAAL